MAVCEGSPCTRVWPSANACARQGCKRGTGVRRAASRACTDMGAQSRAAGDVPRAGLTETQPCTEQSPPAGSPAQPRYPQQLLLGCTGGGWGALPGPISPHSPELCAAAKCVPSPNPGTPASSPCTVTQRRREPRTQNPAHICGFTRTRPSRPPNAKPRLGAALAVWLWVEPPSPTWRPERCGDGLGSGGGFYSAALQTKRPPRAAPPGRAAGRSARDPKQRPRRVCSGAAGALRMRTACGGSTGGAAYAAGARAVAMATGLPRAAVNE